MKALHDNRTISSKGELAIEVLGLHKSFGDNIVLKGFNLSLKKGENLAVLGKSGSGKSVLIKCIIGLIEPEQGEIKIFGRDILKMKRTEMDEVRNRVGFLFQNNALYDSMTVRENLEFPLRRLQVPKTRKEMDKAVNEVLSGVGLLHAIEMMPSELSGGMKKRISIARTLIMNPDIILYDEPTTGLDPVTSKEISNLMLEVQKKYNTSSIIISHDIGCIKMTADRIIVLVEGVNYAEGTFKGLSGSADEKVKAFFS